MISGTPTDAQTASFTGQVNDAAGAMAFRAFTVNIVSPGLAVRNSSNLAGAEIGVPYMQLLSASGGSQKLIWSLSGGTLPPGLTLSPDGILSGKPLSTGNFFFNVSVTDPATSKPGAQAQSAQAAPDSTGQSFLIGVRPSSADLIFSEGVLPFFAVSGGNNPAGQVISVIATSPAPLPFTVTTTAQWLQVSPTNASTPGNVVVSVDQSGLAPGVYTTSIGFATPGKNPQVVGVTLYVGSTMPALAVSPDSIRVSNRSGTLEAANRPGVRAKHWCGSD